jgi:hypothetical protein
MDPQAPGDVRAIRSSGPGWAPHASGADRAGERSRRSGIRAGRHGRGPESGGALSVVRRVVREERAAAQTAAPDKLVTVAAFARARALSVSTVRAAIREGRLAATKIGRAVRGTATGTGRLGASGARTARVTVTRGRPRSLTLK